MKPDRKAATIFISILTIAVLSASSRAQAQDLVLCPPEPNEIIVFSFYGEAEQDNFGIGLDSAGDFDGDGIVDIIAGAPYMDAGSEDGGAAYVFLGGAAADPNYDFRLLAEAADDQLGYSVAGIGDVDDDGYDDIAVGAQFSDRAGAGRGAVWLIFGSERPFGTRQMILTGEAEGPDAFGHALAGGDYNGDHYPDLVVAAPFDIIGSPQNSVAAKVYIFHGGPAMDSSADVILQAEGFSHEFGWSVDCAGDLNNDGYDDLIVGARYFGTWLDAQRGKAYIFFGGSPMDITADIELVGEDTYCWLGYSVAGAGDVNGDGFDDVLIGSPYFPGGGATNPAFGRVYLLFGGNSMDNVPDVVFDGAANHDQFGWSVDGGMDMNGDDHNDIIVGARFNDCAGQDGGAAYVYYGGNPIDNQADISVGSAAADDALGTAVAMIGDWADLGIPLAATSAIWNDAGQDVNDPMHEGAFGAIFAFAPSISTPLVADFAGSPTSGYAPLTVNFTDLSIGDVNSWDWDFGDDGTSTEQNPSYTYTSAGNYTVSLTIAGPGGSDTETKIEYITVTEPLGIPGDFNGNGCVDWTDLDIFTQYWLNTGCGDPNNWCDGTDLNQSTAVDFADFAVFAVHWLEGCSY